MRLLLLSALLLAGCVTTRGGGVVDTVGCPNIPGGIGANDVGCAVVVGVAAAVVAAEPEPEEPLCRDSDVDPPHTCPKQTR